MNAKLNRKLFLVFNILTVLLLPLNIYAALRVPSSGTSRGNRGRYSNDRSSFFVLICVNQTEKYSSEYKGDSISGGSHVKTTFTEKGTGRVIGTSVSGPDVKDPISDIFTELKRTIRPHDKNSIWVPVFYKSLPATMLKEETSNERSFVYISIDVTEFIYGDSYRLSVNCSVNRKNGSQWSQIYKRQIIAQRKEESNEDNYEAYNACIKDISKSVKSLLMSSLVSCQIMNAVAKDSKTKIVNVKVMNTSPVQIRKLYWSIPSEKDTISATTEKIINPGEKKDLAITFQTNESHATIQWRDVFVSDIEYNSAVE